MKAPTIPKEEFFQLAGSIKESEGKEEFSWKELKTCKDYYAILEYLSRTNVRYIGEGSARVSFYLPSAIDDNGNEINSPCCLKVASNQDGVYQNKSDIKVFQKFGSKFQCFPRLYSYDKEKYYYFLCELATPAIDSSNKEAIDSKEYFSKLKSFIDNKRLSSRTVMSLSNMTDLDCYLESLFDSHYLIYVDSDNVTNASKEDLDLFKKEWIAFWKDIKGKEFKYSGISDVSIGFMNDDFYDSDIDHADNWGYVKRKESLVLLPIDFGIGE